MKTEELKALGLNDDQVQKVFAMHGEDVNREKQATTEVKGTADSGAEPAAGGEQEAGGL